MNPDNLRLQAAIDVTKRGIDPLNWSLENDISLLGSSGVATGNQQALRAIDAFIQRFQQVLEHITHRLFPAIYRAETIGERPPALRTLLTYLHEAGLVADPRDWQRRIELRNQLVHEYPIGEDERHEAIAAMLAESRELVRAFNDALDYIARKELLSEFE